MAKSIAEMGKGAPQGALLKQAALGEARLNHEQTDCDDFDPAASSTDRERVYCKTCGVVLLRWGGVNA